MWADCGWKSFDALTLQYIYASNQVETGFVFILFYKIINITLLVKIAGTVRVNI